MKIPLRTFCLFFLSLCVSPGMAQPQKGLLWEISGNGLQAPSFLFGTIHLICPDQLEITEEVTKALDQSDKLVLELDMDEPEFMEKTQQLSLNEEMKNLSERLSENDLKTLNEFFIERYGADMSQLGVLKPLVLLSMMMAKGLDCKQPGSFEMELMKIAKAADKEVLGLESVEEQYEVFDAIPQEQQIGWLIDYAKNYHTYVAGMKDLMNAYKSEQIAQMLELFKQYPEYAGMQRALLDERNLKWIKPILEYAKLRPTFFAVGAAHLGGENGLIELLKAEGYDMKVVTAN